MDSTTTTSSSSVRDLIVFASEETLAEILLAYSITLQLSVGSLDDDDDGANGSFTAPTLAPKEDAGDKEDTTAGGKTVKVKFVNGPKNTVITGPTGLILEIHDLINQENPDRPHPHVYSSLISTDDNISNGNLTGAAAAAAAAARRRTDEQRRWARLLGVVGFMGALAALSEAGFDVTHLLFEAATGTLRLSEEWATSLVYLVFAIWAAVFVTAVVKLVFYHFFSPLPPPSHPASPFLADNSWST